MNTQIDLFQQDILHRGKIYRPFHSSMVEGWDRVKSGERRPHGWGRYLFEGGYVIFDQETRACVGSVKTLPAGLDRQQQEIRAMPITKERSE